jgi:hypothetical protein
MLDDEIEPTASEFVDFTYYGEVIPAGLERPPRDVEEPRLWTVTNDTARALADKRSIVQQRVGAALAKVTPDKPTTPDAKARRAAVDSRKKQQRRQ